jgi:DNA invertase Pin-like site-specific DNA recombinase
MIDAKSLIPAAQYLRMSTEHQQYSLENQSEAIQRHAESHGFNIVCTYSDSARSGVVLKRRRGLQQLLQDVICRRATYRAILVYDVSRWGRFQDSDEAAHYEFLCKSARVPVHYCAETFANDDTMASRLMKALKRTMAGEYSRELGVKVLAGQKRLAMLGFKQGGSAGYGLRRLLVSPTRQAKQELVMGDRKSIATDRVVLIPGPAQEVQIVRDIYRMFVSDRMSTYAIADELNRRGIKCTGDTEWGHYVVNSILTQPKYCGCNVFNRISARLYTPKICLPKSDWVIVPGAFQPVVEPSTFEAVQQIFDRRTSRKSNEQLLQELKTVLAREGRLSIRIIEKSEGLAAPSTYCKRFGSLQRVYELAGYGRPEEFVSLDFRRRTQGMRDQVIEKIASMFPDEVTVIRQSGKFRPAFRLQDGLMVSVVVLASAGTRRGKLHWRFDPVRRERNFVTLLGRLDESNLSFLDFHLFLNMDKQKQSYLQRNDWRLDQAVVFHDLKDFWTILKRLIASKQMPSVNEE